MLVLGQAALLAALVSSAWAFATGFLGGFTGSDPLTRSSGRGLLASGCWLALASTGLAVALLTDDFRLEYVVQYSCKNQPWVYKLSAFWAGQGGSLLFWALLLAGFGSLAVLFARRTPADLLPWAYSTFGTMILFFTGVAALVTNPFQRLPPGTIPPDGAGLNPLLQNFWMLVHPPTLYLGYVGCAVPFAYALAALAAGRLDSSWTRAVRRTSLWAFAFLTLGIWLGGYWAYIELGWGGFWAWDPVENASLMPWLTLTAFIHSIIAQDRRGLLKLWNLTLVTITLMLSIYGTFLTRSGIIQSVHAFTRSSIGNGFIGFLLLVGLVALGLILWRRGQLRGEAAIESVLSREASFLFGDLLLLGLALLVLILTMWPVISQIFSSQPVTMEPRQFTQVTRPWFLLLVLMMAVGQRAAWRRTTPRHLLRALALPLAVAGAVAGALLLGGGRDPWSLAFLFAAGFVATAALSGMIRLFRPSTSRLSPAPHPEPARLQKLGGLLSHLGVALMVAGIALSTGYRREAAFEALPPGRSVTFDNYQITYGGFDLVNRPEYDGVRLKLAVTAPGSDQPREVMPERRVYGRTRQPASEVAILTTLWPHSVGELKRIGEDLYVIPVEADFGRNTATIQVIVHPFLNALWFGGILLLAGTLLAAWPTKAVMSVPADGNSTAGMEPR